MEVAMTKTPHLIAAGLLTLLGSAGANQVQAQGFTGPELDRMSKERMEALPHRNYGPPPPQSSIPRIPLHAPAMPLACLGAVSFQPVLKEATPLAPAIGTTTDSVAATGISLNGYSQVLYKEGVLGYVRSTSLHPYRNQFNPTTRCSVQGLRPNGVVQFGLSN